MWLVLKEGWNACKSSHDSVKLTASCKKHLGSGVKTQAVWTLLLLFHVQCLPSIEMTFQGERSQDGFTWSNKRSASFFLWRLSFWACHYKKYIEYSWGCVYHLSVRQLSARLISETGWFAQGFFPLGFENVEGWHFLGLFAAALNLLQCWTTVPVLLIQLAII